MRAKEALLKAVALIPALLVWSVAELRAQSVPTITTQPTNQTVVPGAMAAFSVGVSGSGPLSYQWQFDGTNLPANIITTVAGNGSGGPSGVYTGDGGAATNVSFDSLYGLTLDAAGNLFIADRGFNTVRKVDATGIITTVAGTGNSGGYFGDGGAATSAKLSWPGGLVFDAAGNLYIADSGNSRIRRMATNGVITTVVGTGNIYGSLGDGGAATSANLNYAKGVAFDTAGNLYIADVNNHRIRKVDTNGIINTVAGRGIAGYAGDGGAATNARLNSPNGVVVDTVGNLYISDFSNYCIRKVGTNGIITTLAGIGAAGYSGDGGAATNAILGAPNGVSLDAFGNLVIADSQNYRVRVVDNNGIITTVAGNGSTSYSGDGGPATSAGLMPSSVAFDVSGNLYIADDTMRIRKVLTFATLPAFTLRNVTTDNAGNYGVVVTSPYGCVTSSVVTLTVGVPPSILIQPTSQVVQPGGNATLRVRANGSSPLYYSWYFNGSSLLQSGTNTSFTLTSLSAGNAGSYTVVVTNAYGSVTSDVVTLVLQAPAISTLPASQSVAPGANVTLNVVAAGAGPFSYQWQFNGTNLPNNIITTVAGNGVAGFSGDGSAATNASLKYPAAVALDAFGNLFIADENNYRIRKVDIHGNMTTVAGRGTAGGIGDGGQATNAYLYQACGLALDAAGNLYIDDMGNNCIRKVDTNGIITTFAGTFGGDSGDGGPATSASLHYPTGVALDAAGNLYIADNFNSRVRKVSANGIISTVAGNHYGGGPGGGFSGDGGLATNASLAWPSGVVSDAAGNLYIADTSNSRIRKVGIDGVIATVAGNGVWNYSGDGGAATNAALNYPTGVVLDAAGNLFIADEHNNLVRKVDTTGTITTAAGNGNASCSGDGAPASSAGLSANSVALDASGNLYIADASNNRIREVHFAGYPLLSLPNVTSNNTGNYTVIVSNPYGSVTSAVAMVTVVIPFQLVPNDASFGFRTNRFGFYVSGASNQNIVVDGSTNLVDWTALFTNTYGGNEFYFCDPAPTNLPQRYYRARRP